MLNFTGGASRYCDGVSRRDALQVGAASILGLSMADFFRADAVHANDASYSKKSFINVFLSGGPSHMDMWDLKPEAPMEFRGEFKPIDTCVSGIQICEHLPKLAARMDKLAIIRSIAGLVDEHASNQTESGWNGNSLRTSGGRPSIGAVVSKVHGTSNGAAPTFVDLTGVSRPGFLGSVHSAFRPDGEGRENLSLRNMTTQRLDNRKELLYGLDRLKRDADASGSMTAMDSFAQRAVGVITSGQLAKALDLNREDPRTRERYLIGDQGRENERFLVARRLVQAGVRVVSMSWGGWDTHGQNFVQLKNQLPRLDHGIAMLIEDLEAHGLLNDTVIAVWGEFGRTPRVNATAGRDHWPRAASVMLAGGAFRKGQAIGSTNRLGEEPKDRPVHLQEIFTTLYHHLGIDARYTTLVDSNGRPQYLVEKPNLVTELVS